MGQILNGRDTSGADNNAVANMGESSDTRDGSSTGGTDNNTDGKNARIKAGFST